MQAGLGAAQERFVQAAVWIWKGVRVKSSIGEFRVRSSQGSCNCTCRGSAGTIPRAQSLRDTRKPPHIGIKDRRWFGEGAEPGPRHCGTRAVYIHTVCMAASSTLATLQQWHLLRVFPPWSTPSSRMMLPASRRRVVMKLRS